MQPEGPRTGAGAAHELDLLGQVHAHPRAVTEAHDAKLGHARGLHRILGFEGRTDLDCFLGADKFPNAI